MRKKLTFGTKFTARQIEEARICDSYNLEIIKKLFGGEKFLSVEQLLALQVRDSDKVFIFCKLDQRCFILFKDIFSIKGCTTHEERFQYGVDLIIGYLCDIDLEDLKEENHAAEESS